ncbi:YSIRK-type signal peptide-containing protein [Thermosynechococcus vestitus]|nr:YSIRK-type signal peptide-containing protein [Thermosynechococcus vestitus]
MGSILAVRWAALRFTVGAASVSVGMQALLAAWGTAR